MVTVAMSFSVTPVSFIALSAWVIVQLPKETAFFHAFGFLVFRLKLTPFCYVLVLLVKNLAVALITMLGDEAIQLFVFFR